MKKTPAMVRGRACSKDKTFLKHYRQIRQHRQQSTPGAYRIFWHYGPGKNIISLIVIMPHPYVFYYISNKYV